MPASHLRASFVHSCAKVEDDVHDEVEVHEHVHDREPNAGAADEGELQRQHHTNVQHEDDRDQVPVYQSTRYVSTGSTGAAEFEW